MFNDYLNEYQRDYRKEMEAIAPRLRCYCGWYKLGECPHCQKDRTCEDKLKDRGNSLLSSVCRCNDLAGRNTDELD